MAAVSTSRIRIIGSWIMAGVFAVLAAFLIVQNLHRACQAEQNRWFKKQNWIYGPPNERTKNDPVQPYGWEFDRYQEAEIHLRPLRDTQRFSLRFRLQLRGFDRLNFRLLGEPFSADLLIWGHNLPAYDSKRTSRVDVERYPDRVELYYDGRKIDERALGQQLTIDGFLIKSIGSDFTVEWMEVARPGRRPLLSHDFAFPFRRPYQQSLAILALVALFVVLAFAVRGSLSFPARLNRVLFAATPLWAGLLFPLSVSVGDVVWLMSTLSLLLLFGNRLVPLTGRGRRIAAVILPIAAVILSLLLLRTASDNSARWLVVPALAGLAAWLAAALRHAHLDAWRVLAPAFFPATVGLALYPWLKPSELGVSAALLLATLFMLFQTCHAHRRELPTYAALMLALTFALLGAAEINARLSEYNSRWQPMNLGKTFRPEDDLLFVPAGLLSNNTSFNVGRLQFRGRVPTTDPHPGTYRVFAMGGSNTYGDWIEQNEQTFSGLLEACLNRTPRQKKIEVINAGVKGFILFQLLKLFENYALEYRPDMVILYVSRNDSSDLRGPFTLHELWRMRNEGKLKALEQELQSRRGSTDTPPAWIAATQDQLQGFRLYNALVTKVIGWRQRNLPKMPSRFQFTKDVNPVADITANLEDFAAACRRYGVKLVLFEEYDFSYRGDPNTKAFKVRAAMKAFAAREKLPFLSINDVFHARADKAKLVFDFDLVHLSYYGHQEVARLMCDFLEQNRLVPR